MVGPARYRVGQFLQALTARVAEEETEKATHILASEARSIFRRQTIQDQRHALAVYAALHQAGQTNPDLLTAALLHDVGKAAAGLTPWWRAVIVLLDRFAPRLLARLSGEEIRDCVRDNSPARSDSTKRGASTERSRRSTDEVLPDEVLPDEVLPDEVLPDEVLPDEVLPDEVLPDEVLPTGWHRPFVAHAQHPEIGADWARAAGCSALTVALVRRHQDRLVSRQTEEDKLLAALQAADGRN